MTKPHSQAANPAKPALRGWRARRALRRLVPVTLHPGAAGPAGARLTGLRALRGRLLLLWRAAGGAAGTVVEIATPAAGRAAFLRTPEWALGYREWGAAPPPGSALADHVARVVYGVAGEAARLAADLEGLDRPIEWMTEGGPSSEEPPTSEPRPGGGDVVRFADPCGLHCTFCDAHRLPPSATLPSPREQLRALVARGARAVLFCDGEPLHHPGLEELVAEARGEGLRVEAQTAGPPLAEPGRAERLAEAGLAAVHVALYGPLPSIHDQLVGLPGAFAATLDAIERSRSAGLRVHGATVLFRSNVGMLDATARLLAEHTGEPAVRLTWARPPDADPVRYRRLAVPVDEGLGAVVKAFGPGFLWRRPLVWWAPPCVVRSLGLGESPRWSAVGAADHVHDREPHHRLGACPHAAECAFDCRFYDVYLEAFGGEGLRPVRETPPAAPDEPGPVTDATTVWPLT